LYEKNVSGIASKTVLTRKEKERKRENKKAMMGMMLTAAMLVTSTLIIAFNLAPVRAQEPSIEIWEDFTLDRDITFSDTGFIVKADNVTLDLNGHTITGTGELYGIHLWDVDGVTVKNGEISDFFCGIYLSDSSNNNKLVNNTVSNNNEGILLYSYSNNNKLVNNTVSNNNEGILLYSYSNNNKLTKNTILNSSVGISLSDFCNNNTITSNTVSNCHVGIYLKYASTNQLINNVVLNATPSGIWLQHSSCSNTIINNIVSDTTKKGIYIDHLSGYNRITGNTISNNSPGIYIEQSSDNSIYYNNFIDNKVQIESIGSTNTWDNGAGGNYWSDYEERYPNATEIDDSGIWDTPYVIDGDNQDNHSRMEPGLIVDVTWGEGLDRCAITTVTEFVVSSFSFNKEQKQISLTVLSVSTGPCNVTIPRGRLDGPFNVTIDGIPVNYTLTQNENNCFISFTCESGLHNVIINGSRRGFIIADINCDAKVDIRDIAIAAKNFGNKEEDYP